MNNFGEATNPFPYIMAAYLLGVVCIFGYSTWLQMSRRRVERYLSTFKRS
jgi:hypothetical protein